MIVLLRSTDGCPDSRLQKYVDVLSRNNIPYNTVCWDRDCKLVDNDKQIYYHKKSRYSLGWKNIIGLLGFNFFILKWLINNRKKIKAIHACDFDTIMPALLFKLFFRTVLIYDIFDWYVDSRNLSIFKYFILLLEWINLKFADVTIICEEERKKQLCTIPRRCLVLPNIPNLPNFSHRQSLSTDTLKESIHLSYVGILSKNRGLERVLHYVSDNPSRYSLTIAGFGELENIVKEYSKKYENIIYCGTVEYAKGLEIMDNSDLIMAVYELSVPNHIYAAPNKYYEGLFLGKPILTTKGTFVGTKTEKGETGFTVEDSYISLSTLLDKITLKDINSAGQKAKILWSNKYSTYVDYFMNDYYIPLANS